MILPPRRRRDPVRDVIPIPLDLNDDQTRHGRITLHAVVIVTWGYADTWDEPGQGDAVEFMRLRNMEGVPRALAQSLEAAARSFVDANQEWCVRMVENAA